GIRALAISRTLGRYFERLVSHEATFRILAGLRVWFYNHLEPLAPAGLQYARSGDLLNRIQADIDTLDNAYLRILLPLMAGLAGVALVTLFMALHHPAAAMATLVFLLLAGLVFPLWVRARARAPGGRLVETRAALRTAVVDGVRGLGELSVFGAAERQAGEVEREGNALIDDQRHMSRLTGLSGAIMGLCANLALWTLLLVSIPAVNAGALEPPKLAMLALLVLAAFEAVMPLPLAFQVLDETLAAARRLFSLADQQPPVAEPRAAETLPAETRVLMEHVGFTYPDAPSPALEGFDLDLAPGRRVALVGATGSGKTTVTQLLLRFRLPASGTIRIGNISYADLEGESVRRLFAVAAQHSHIFNATIRDNLRIAAADASDATIEQACHAARIHDFIAGQPDGYDTWVGEAGVKLSGGQIRRLAIARALLKPAPLVILDEPGEGLDPPTEADMMAAVLDYLGDARALLLITHRGAGLNDMDEILLLDQGHTRARGTHKELLDTSATYRLLFERMD
ncbi:MAG: thiol reductant ABC exporter subunit CydC, partial [Pseudomonadota bacterium]